MRTEECSGRHELNIYRVALLRIKKKRNAVFTYGHAHLHQNENIFLFFKQLTSFFIIFISTQLLFNYKNGVQWYIVFNYNIII